MKGLDYMNKEIDVVYKKHKMLIEMYAAAFLKEVGSEEASKYKLVQRFEGNHMVWEFELR